MRGEIARLICLIGGGIAEKELRRGADLRSASWIVREQVFYRKGELAILADDVVFRSVVFQSGVVSCSLSHFSDSQVRLPLNCMRRVRGLPVLLPKLSCSA